MAGITLICMGRLKERFYLEAAAEYQKRLGAFGPFQLLELPECRLPEDPGPAEIQAALKKEAEAVRVKLPKGGWLGVFTPEGSMLTSPELAETVSRARLSGRSQLTFLIGSSFGIDPELKRQADCRISLSRMTFPHHLARVMVLEQLYRAESILAGSKYHK